MSDTKNIAVIIPVLNEEQALPACLNSLDPKTSEIIVVDGGSTDHSREIAQASGAKVISTKSSRAVQMNSGASATTASILLFLHADTTLPKHYGKIVQRELNKPHVVAGAFKLRISDNDFFFRIISFFANLRSDWLNLPYGDQALFLKRETFNKLGGFTNYPLLEDLDLVRRLKTLGRITTVRESVVTSGRRWHTRGKLKVTLFNVWALLSFSLGNSPDKIAVWYKR